MSNAPPAVDVGLASIIATILAAHYDARRAGPMSVCGVGVSVTAAREAAAAAAFTVVDGEGRARYTIAQIAAALGMTEKATREAVHAHGTLLREGRLSNGKLRAIVDRIALHDPE